MRKYLLPHGGQVYKANLHMHTTVSDGNMTPEETKEEFVKRGYSVVAFTDHEVIVPHEELCDENFLAITSAEVAVNAPTPNPFDFVKTHHLNLYALDPKNVNMPCFTESAVWLKNSKEFVTEEMRRTKFARTYDTACVNEMIRLANEAGYLVSYNHPVWSLADYSAYGDLKGLWGVECFNTGCVREGYPDTVQPLDDLLRKNERVFPLATDDAHRIEDCFGGFVMIHAPKLDYASVMDALKKGDFYASTAPLIRELWIEDGKVHLECTAAAAVTLSTERRFAMRIERGDGLFTCAEWDLSEFFERSRAAVGDCPPHYFRITVRDERGREAYTRAYFL